MTQLELAKVLGVQLQTVWCWEHGNREPSLDIIKKLCEILKLHRIKVFELPYYEDMRFYNIQWEVFTRAVDNLLNHIDGYEEEASGDE